MAAHNILSKVDRALRAYLLTVPDAGTDGDIHPAKRSLDKTLPCTVCFSQRAAPASLYSGVWLVEASVMVKTVAAIDQDEAEDTPKSDSELRVGATFDAFFVSEQAAGDGAGDKLAALITAAARATGDPDLATFTVQNVEVKGPEAGFEPKGSVWVDTLDLEILCCSADVA